jgi:Zn-dependent protease with chaperone function
VTSPVVHHLAVLLVCLTVCAPLRRARWTTRAPQLAVALWQAWLVALTLSLIGLPLQLGLAPFRASTPAAFTRAATELGAGRLVAAIGPTRAGLLAAVGVGTLASAVTLIAAYVRLVRLRRRHIDALTLVADRHPTASDALVVDVADRAVYCLPGTGVVVFTAGALDGLTDEQLAAVLAHERAHLRARHDIALLPFIVLARVLPIPPVRSVLATVALLVEMCADDRAARSHGRDAVRAALLRFADTAGPVPPGALAASGAVTARVLRLTGPVPALSLMARAGIVAGGLLVATTPLSQLAWPY